MAANITGLPVGCPISDTDRHTSPVLPLGSIFFDKNGNEYRYVKAGGAIAVKEAVTVAADADPYNGVVATSAISQYVLGVATAAFADKDYGLLQTRGKAVCKVVVGTAAGSLLVTSATAGTLKLATEAESLAGAKSAVALVIGVAAGSEIALGI